MLIKRGVATPCNWLAASAKDAIPQCRIGYTLRCRVSSGLYPQAYRGRGREEKQGTLFCRVAVRFYPHWGILGRSISGSLSKGKDDVHGYEGARFIKVMMTVVTTLKQHRHVLRSMTDACQSAYTRLPAPSLRPRHPEAEEDFPVAAYPPPPKRLPSDKPHTPGHPGILRCMRASRTLFTPGACHSPASVTLCGMALLLRPAPPADARQHGGTTSS